MEGGTDAGLFQWERLFLEKIRRYSILDLENDKMWGKERKPICSWWMGKCFCTLRNYKEDSRSGDLMEKNDDSWILLGIFCVSDTDKLSGNLRLVLRRDNGLVITI